MRVRSACLTLTSGVFLLGMGFMLGRSWAPAHPDVPEPPAWAYFFIEVDPAPLIALGELAAPLAPDLLSVFTGDFDTSVEFPKEHPAHGVRVHHRHAVYAATVLGLLRYEDALPDLLVGLEHCSVKNRHVSDYCSEVLRALGRIGGDRAATAILAFRTYDYDSVAKNEALHMLDFANAMPAIQAFDEPVPDAPLNVLMNLSALAETRARYGPGRGLPAALRESDALAERVLSYLTDQDPQVRIYATRCLGLFDSEQAFRALVAALDGDPDLVALRRVLDALVLRGDQQAANVLLEFASRQLSADIEAATLFALARLPAAPYQPAGGMLSVLSGEEVVLRRLALQTLYLQDDPAAWEAFTRAHPAPAIQGAFEVAEAVRGGASGDEAVRMLLKEPEEAIGTAIGHYYWVHARTHGDASYDKEAFLRSFFSGEAPRRDLRHRLDNPTDADIEALIAQVRETSFWAETHPAVPRPYTLLLDALYRATGRNFGADHYAWYSWWEGEKRRRTSEARPGTGP